MKALISFLTLALMSSTGFAQTLNVGAHVFFSEADMSEARYERMVKGANISCDKIEGNLICKIRKIYHGPQDRQFLIFDTNNIRVSGIQHFEIKGSEVFYKNQLVGEVLSVHEDNGAPYILLLNSKYFELLHSELFILLP